MGALSQVYDVVRNDAANLAARADEDTARTALVQHLCDKITEFKKRFDILEARVNEAEGYRRTPLLSAPPHYRSPARPATSLGAWPAEWQRPSRRSLSLPC